MIEKLVLNMGINAMKDNFLALDDEEKQSEFCKLLDENQELKAKINGVYEERTYLYNKLSTENEQLNNLVNTCQEEIRQLKKQLESANEQISCLRRSIERKEERIIDLQYERIPYTNEYVDKLLNQQKEFMNFLTEAINKLKLKQKTSNSAILKANIDLQVEVYSIVLSKYKEIIGDDK